MNSREIVLAALEFRPAPRVPFDLWMLPWAQRRYPDEATAILRDYPWDFACAPPFYREIIPGEGDAYRCGTYLDEWGCRFVNIHDGIIGEVKEPPIADWDDVSHVHIPEELLSIDIPEINRWCQASDKFLLAGCCPRPFERMQFLRGTENLYLDLALDEPRMLAMLTRVHDFYCRKLELWGQTKVDALRFMDDWGAQQSLLISPEMWRRIFKPLYRDYVSIARKYGKKIMMHSDGNILAIYPDLIEIGVDAVNSQLFCMGVENLAPFAGKITFWGEIDRQYYLNRGTPKEITQAVESVYEHLGCQGGGVIAQCEFGPGATPDRVRRVFDTWLKISGDRH